MINRDAHLTDEEIILLNDDQLKGAVLLRALRHIEQCRFCQQRVPPPTKAETDRIFFDKLPVNSNSSELLTIGAASWKTRTVLAGLSLSLIFCVGYLLMRRISINTNSSNVIAENTLGNNKADDLTVRKTISNSVSDAENNNVGSTARTEVLGVNPANKSVVVNLPQAASAQSKKMSSGKAHSNTPRENISRAKTSIAKRIRRSSSKPNEKQFTAPQSNFAVQMETSQPSSEQKEIAVLRGTINPKLMMLLCPDELIDMTDFENEVASRNPTFHWKTINGAIKYQFTLIDDQRNLVAEFENEKATSYKINSELKEKTVYRWSVIVTTRDGSEIVHPWVEFKIDSFETNRKWQIVRRPLKSDSRCVSK